MNKSIWIGLCYCVVGQVMVWIQTNSQFVWPWTLRYKWPLAILGGTIISYLFMTGATYIVNGSSGHIWPARLIPAATGTLIFTAMTWIFMRQGIDAKTGICIALSLIILIIQIYWK